MKRTLISTSLQLFIILGIYANVGDTYAYAGRKLKNFCYFTNWSNKLSNTAARFELSDINATLCTHMIYAFATIAPQSMKLIKSQSDDDNGQIYNKQGRYFNFTKMANSSGSVALLSVGGAAKKNDGWIQVVESTQTMTLFARNCAIYLRDRNFGGLDIDWEWPDDIFSEKYTQLLKIMRVEFDREAFESGLDPLLITIAVGVGQNLINTYNITEIVKYVDYVLVMAYDFHGPWSKLTSFTAPLYSRNSDSRFNSQLSQQWAIDEWLWRGAPAEKVVMGLTGVATTFTLADRALTGVGEDVSGPGTPGPYLQAAGHVPYYRVCELIRQGAKVSWDDEQKMAYAVQNDQWMGFGDPRSMRRKVEFAYSRRLAGTMFWSMEHDDFKGRYCEKGKFPLLTAINDAIQSGPVYIGPTRSTGTPQSTETTTPIDYRLHHHTNKNGINNFNMVNSSGVNHFQYFLFLLIAVCQLL